MMDAEHCVAGDVLNVHTWPWKLRRFATNTLSAENYLLGFGRIKESQIVVISPLFSCVCLISSCPNAE